VNLKKPIFDQLHLIEWRDVQPFQNSLEERKQTSPVISASEHSWSYLDTIYKATFWNTTNTDNLRHVISASHHPIVLLVYSPNDKTSTAQLNNYATQLQRRFPQTHTKLVIMVSVADFTVKKTDAADTNFAQQHNYSFVQVCSATGRGVPTLQKTIFELARRYRYQNRETETDCKDIKDLKRMLERMEQMIREIEEAAMCD